MAAAGLVEARIAAIWGCPRSLLPEDGAKTVWRLGQADSLRVAAAVAAVAVAVVEFGCDIGVGMRSYCGLLEKGS